MEKSIKIPSKIESLREIEKLIDDIAAEYKLTSEVYGNVLIASLEAVNNAIMHGNKQDNSKEVDVAFILDKSKLRVQVKDQGPGFDYNNIPDPTAPENLENINGRGIFLMQKLSDNISFSDEGSLVELIFNIK
ncbi:MAG: ATP-binding protein [Bacteroidales bacterium]|nr:ATP-binding protein [Bacteroidales bacterium]